jgi:hypothetical protein
MACLLLVKLNVTSVHAELLPQADLHCNAANSGEVCRKACLRLARTALLRSLFFGLLTDV